MLIHHFLEHSADRFPDKIAVIHKKSRTTYRQINIGAERLSAVLLSRGISVGDRVVIILENSIEYIVAYYGILKIGAVTVPLNTDLKPAGLNLLLAKLQPAAIISSSRFENLIKTSDLNVPNLNTLIIHNSKLNWDRRRIAIFPFEHATHSQPQPQNQTNSTNLIPSSNLASIIYTSGSTGQPKGVMLNHKNIVANVDSICQSLRLKEDDIQMVVLPFFYVMGKSLLNTIFAVGGTLVINNMFAFPATVVNQMIKEKVTLFSGVPSTFSYLLYRSPLKKYRKYLKHLRMVTQAGGHMARSVKMSLREALPNHTQICIMYGATEASARLTWLDPDWFDLKMDSIGLPIPNVNIRIIDRNGLDVPQGERGEIVAKGPNIMQGYWKDRESMAKALDENGYHTGDIAWQDEDGFIFLDGRTDSLLKVGGHRINPQEIEDALMATGLFVEAAVVGMPDNLLGYRLVAVLVPLISDLTPEAIMRQCSSLLPQYKLPAELHFVKSLPKKANGKIDRSECVNIVRHRGYVVSHKSNLVGGG